MAGVLLTRLPQLVKEKDLCVECGLGLLMMGSYTLDGDKSIAWHCPVMEANRILIDLRERLGDKGTWIELF